MNILVLLKMVPDVVEELSVASDGKTLDTEFLRTILSERDDHALEEALLLKERYGGTITALVLDGADVDDVLFTALAKGVDRAAKIVGLEMIPSTRTLAQLFAQVLTTAAGFLPVDLILTGVQALDDLDGQLAPLLAHRLGMPYLGTITQVAVDRAQGLATVVKEYAGGVRGEFEIILPAVLGIQAAEKPPRYVPVAKVRAAMKTHTVESIPAPTLEPLPPLPVVQMSKPEVIGHAEMLEGTPEAIADQIWHILVEHSLV